MLRLSMMLAARQRLNNGLASDLASTSTSTLGVLRLVLYLAITIAAFGAITIVAVESFNPVTLFEDDGPWEWLEFYLLMASAAMFFANACRHEIYTHILKLCGLLALFGGFRELDYFLDGLVFQGAYKVINGVILILFVYLVWMHRWTLTKTLARFTKTAPFYLLVAAALVVVYSQIIGQAELWKAIMEPVYIRAVKRVVEELAEFMGYLLLLFAAIETCFLNDAHPHPSPSVEKHSNSSISE